jgi:WD40 repeat protein
LKSHRSVLSLIHDSSGGSINSVAFSPDGTTIATAGEDSTAKTWSAKTGKSLGTFEHKAAINSLSFSSDGQRLATASDDQTAKVWDVSKGTEIVALPHSNSVKAVLLGKNAQFAFTADADGKITVWYLKPQFSLPGLTLDTAGPVRSANGSLSFTQLLPLVAHTGPIHSIAMSPNGEWLASAGHDKTIRIWNITSIPRSPIYDVALSPDGHLLAVATSDGISVRIFDSGLELYSRRTLFPRKVLFSQDGRFLWVAGFVDIYQLNANLGTMIRSYSCMFCRSMALRPGTSDMVSADPTNLSFWTSESPSPINIKLQNGVSQIAFNVRGALLAIAFLDGSIGIMDAITHKTLSTLPPSGSQILALAFHPTDENMLATGGQDHKIRIWDVKTGKRTLELGGHSGQVNSLAFSNDGSQLASGSADGTVRLWTMPKGGKLATITGHTDEVRGLTFGSDGRLVSGSLDKTILVYDSDSKRLLQEGWSQVRRPLTQDECDTFLPSETCPTEFNTFTEGVKLAQAGKLTDAIAKFEKVHADNETFLTEPKKMAIEFRVQYLIERVNLLARSGDVNAALDLLKEVKDMDPERAQAAIEDLVQTSELLLTLGMTKPLLDLANRGKEVNANFNLSPSTLNDLCWYGSLLGSAKDVLFACERAVNQSSGDPRFRDSRGVALALTGKPKEAIPDFEAYAMVLSDPNRKRSREEWILLIQHDKMPFTSQERMRLLKQSGLGALR